MRISTKNSIFALIFFSIFNISFAAPDPDIVLHKVLRHFDSAEKGEVCKPKTLSLEDGKSFRSSQFQFPQNITFEDAGVVYDVVNIESSSEVLQPHKFSDTEVESGVQGEAVTTNEIFTNTLDNGKLTFETLDLNMMQNVDTNRLKHEDIEFAELKVNADGSFTYIYYSNEKFKCIFTHNTVDFPIWTSDLVKYYITIKSRVK